MSVTLRAVLPRVFPDFCEAEHWLVIDHQGKSDLEASFPRKMSAWREPGVRFIILRDNDGADCGILKERLLALMPSNSPEHRIRIVCQELESWFLGDLAAVATAFPSAKRESSFRTLRPRDPDTLTNASELLKNLTGTGAKVTRAIAIAAHMNPAANRSKSFEVLMSGVANLLSQR